MTINQIKETCLYVADLDRTKNFYSGKLGLPVIGMVAGRHVFFQAGTSVLLCFIARQTMREEELPPHGASGSMHLAFEVADYDNTVKSLDGAGIPILYHQLWNSGKRSAYFHDPDGHLLEIVEPGLWDR